jgi:hypothetical protein
MKDNDHRLIQEIYSHLTVLQEEPLIEEKGLDIQFLTSFDEAEKEGEGTDWLICKDKKIWDAYRDYGTDFFVIKSEGKKIGVTLHTNKALEIYTTDNKVLTEKDLSDLLAKHDMSIKDLEVTVK